MPLAPIALFVFRRPDHTRRTIESLLANPEAAKSDLVVFADGPRSERDADAVERTRAVVRAAGIPRLRVIEREKNMGLAASVVAGVTELCDAYGRAIVLEDDLVLAPTFVRFMNESLDRYRDDPRVYAVSGYMFPIQPSSRSDAVFLPFPSSWGWATWARAWKQLAPAHALYGTIAQDRKLRRRFDVDGSYPFTAMLEALLAGRVDSWAIRWRATVFLNRGLTLYPARSLVTNIGFDGTGVHCGAEAPLFGAARASFAPIAAYPAAVETDEDAYQQVRRIFLHDTSAGRKVLRTTSGAFRRIRGALFRAARRKG